MKAKLKVFLFKHIFLSLKVRPFWNTLILFLPSIWLPLIVKYLGERLYLTTNGVLNSFGLVLTILVYIICFFILVNNNIFAKNHEDIIQAENKTIESSYNLLDFILESTREVCLGEYQNLLNFLKDNGCKDTYCSYTNSNEQIIRILNETSKCLCAVTDLKKKNIVIKLAYKLNIDKENWKWISDTQSSDEFEQHSIWEETESTFYQISSGLRNFTFYNDKEAAEKAGHYVMDRNDKSNNCIGSIICFNANVADQDLKYVDAVISIGTYGKKIVNDDNLDRVQIVENNFKDNILPEFKIRLQTELALLYIKAIIEKNNSAMLLNQ